MENNFYVGDIFHSKKYTKSSRVEKTILYSEDSLIYIDLLNQKEYTTDNNNRDYVIKESLINTDVREYKTDYNYLLMKYKSTSKRKERKLFNRKY